MAEHYCLFYETVSCLDELCTRCHEQLEELRKEKSGAYRERNLLVAALSKLFPAVLMTHVDKEGEEPWDGKWKTVVAIDLPTGQVTWHVEESEVLASFSHLPRIAGNGWDGHDTEEKYRRLAALPSRAS